MVFTLVSAGQEWLNEKWDRMKREKEEKVLAKIRADEEAEQVNCFIISIPCVILIKCLFFINVFLYYFYIKHLQCFI